MTKRPPPPHWLRLNHATASPTRLLVFDTETTWERLNGTEIHRPRLWAALTITRHREGELIDERRAHHGSKMAELAALVDAYGQAHPEVWVFAHNLGFDLQVSALPDRLCSLGWELKDLWLGDESTWVVFTHGRHKIVATDTWSWLRSGLEDIARAVGRQKVKLPANEDSAEAWAKRCAVDCSVLADALVELMGWWDRHELGRWGITGTGCGWAAARHKLAPKSILVGPDPERNRWERRAIYGGHREVFYVGPLYRDLASDYDLANCYATVAATHTLPRRPVRPFDRLNTDHPWLYANSVGVIAEAEITTETPCVPARVAGEVWYPTGTFRTTLASPELALALEMGAKVDIGHGWAYDLGNGLQAWATWVLALLAGEVPDTPPLARILAKSWGRAVIGRFAARTSREVMRRPALTTAWTLEHGRDQETGSDLDIISIAGTERWLLKDQEGGDSFPALLAWVESIVRAALYRIMASRPEGSVIQCDTDGWLERERPTKRAPNMPEAPWPFTIHRKGRYGGVRIIGPQHLHLGRERRLAGVGRTAELVGRDTWEWWDWPGIRWQLTHSTPGSYSRRKRTSELHLDMAHRWVMEDGATVPIRTEVAADGTNRVLPWADTWPLGQALHLAESQHPTLLKTRQT